MITLRLDAAGPATIAAAAEQLRRGLPVVFPTDTVYGIGVLPFDTAAIERLYAAKGRPAEKGIPVLLADPADVAQVAATIPPAAAALMARFASQGRDDYAARLLARMRQAFGGHAVTPAGTPPA